MTTQPDIRKRYGYYEDADKVAYPLLIDAYNNSTVEERNGYVGILPPTLVQHFAKLYNVRTTADETADYILSTAIRGIKRDYKWITFPEIHNAKENVMRVGISSKVGYGKDEAPIKEGLNILVTSTGLDVQLLHYKTLLYQWFNMYIIGHHHIWEDSIKKLIDVKPFELELMLRLVVPDEFSNRSHSYLANYFAVATGCLIPKELDVTLDPESWNFITGQLRPGKLGSFHITLLRSLHEYPEGKHYPPRDSYYFLSRPEFRQMVRLYTGCLSVDEGTPEQKLPYFTELGVKRDAYQEEYANHRIGDGYYPGDPGWHEPSSFIFDRMLYVIHKYLGYRRESLPAIFRIMNDDMEKQAKHLLRHYSDFELIARYIPHWKLSKSSYKEDQYVERIYFDQNTMIEWIVRGYRSDMLDWHPGADPAVCSNKNYYDPITTESRTITLEDAAKDPDDSRLYYGVFQIDGAHRRCFSVKILTDSFRDTEYGFEFFDPDWYPEDAVGIPLHIDPFTDKPIARIMKRSMVLKLKKYLHRTVDYLRNVPKERRGEDKPRDLVIKALYDKIVDGETRMASSNADILREADFLLSRPQWRNDLLIYFGWVFLFAMWIRFWKGPGNPYPMQWIDTDRNRHNDRCDSVTRDEHINIELSLHGAMLTALENRVPMLANHIKSIPYYHYEWTTGLITKPKAEIAEELLHTSTLEGIVDKVQLEDFCMAQASDLISGTAFIYLTKVLQVPLDKLNDLLVHVMLLLRQWEIQAINSREVAINSINTSLDPSDGDKASDKDVKRLKERVKRKQDAMKSVEQHRNVLNVGNVGFVQPLLDVSNITYTGHLPINVDEFLDE